MTSIKQYIPGFIQGMSDQPDERKIPGQVRSVNNALPDVTLGLIKRPGLQFIADLLDCDQQSKWFNIFCENNIGYEEQYVCNITRSGSVRIWAAVDIKNTAGAVVHSAGDLIPTTQPGAQPLSLQDSVFFDASPAATSDIGYMAHSQPSQIQPLNIGASTLVTNRQVVPTMSSSSGNNRPYEGFIRLDQVLNGRQYAVNVLGPSGSTQTFTRATSLTVNPGSFRKNENDCRFAGLANVTNFSSGGGTNLAFVLTVNCRVIPTDSNDSPGDSDYTIDIDLRNGGDGWQEGQTFDYTFKGYTYTITVASIQTTRVENVFGAIRPPLTPQVGEGGALLADAILSDIKDGLDGLGFFNEVKIIGNGIYVSSSQEFTLTTPEDDLMTVMSTSTETAEDPNPGARYTTVNNVGDLPQQCKHGYIVKVANSFTQDDDYYLKFVGNEKDDGDGVWEETIKPTLMVALNPSTMPHLIRRSLASDGTIVFSVSPIDWIKRTVGDDATNPIPSFVDDGTVRPTINNMLLYRNRLVFLSMSNVVLSQSGDLGNWFADTAITVKDSDPIDINAAVDTSTALYDGLVVNNGMLLFSQFNQFLFTTDGDVLSPRSAKSSLIGTYDFNINSNPFNMASNVGFFSSAGNDSIFWEMRDIFREGPPNVEERSKAVQRSLPGDLDLIVASREDGMVLASKLGSNEIWGYRFFFQGERQVQSAWFKWTIPGTVICHFNNTRGKYWVVYDDDNTTRMMSLDLKDKLRSTSIEGVPYEYYVYLDNWTNIGKPVYNALLKRSEFSLPFTPKQDLFAYSLEVGEFRGVSAPVLQDGSIYYLRGNWTDQDLTVGYPMEMEIKMPHLYVTKREGQGTISDTTGCLTLHRIKVDFSTVGMFTFELDRYGKDKYIMDIETTEMDGYDADRVAGYPDKQYTIPVYDKAENSLLTLKSSHPTPATLTSLTFEGDYTPNYYKRV